VDDTIPGNVQVNGPLETGTVTAGPVVAPEEALTGVLIHRLFASSLNPARAGDAEAVLPRIRGLLTRDELATLVDPDACVRSAVDVWARLRSRPDVAELLAMPDRHHEVPFSAVGGRGILRGSIDCLIRRPDGSLLVIEFKSGHRLPAHQAQLDSYVEAARLMFPGSRVEGRLIYP
jgi:ATP-dependent exoDNAse (exonuclease V) beta subunit